MSQKKRITCLMDERLLTLLGEALSSQPLAERLARVQQLVPRWQRAIELDRLHEGALYAFTKGQPVAGLKYAVKAWLIAPLNFKLAKESWRVMRKKASQHQGQIA